MTRRIVLLAIALALGACGPSNAPAPARRTGEQTAAAPSHVSGSAQGCFVAAAETFESLTESTAAAPVADLASRTASAATQARSCQSSLSEQQSAILDNVLGRIGQFEMTHDRSALALAAVEGYRIFVNAQSRPPGSIPIEVALLDYAGFRYQAGAHSAPPLWSDMRQALEIANSEWRAVSSRVADEHLKTTFSADLADMRAALRASDQTRAQRAVNRELDHVDRLEAYFSRPARG